MVRTVTRNGQDLSNQISGSGSLTTPSIQAVSAWVTANQNAYNVFNADRALYPAAARIDVALQGAINQAVLANSSAGQGDIAGVKDHMRQAINNLVLSDALIWNGNVANPIDVASFVVRQHYVDFLGREPDQSGSDFWTNPIAGCGTDPQCIAVNRVNVSAAFFLSIEFQQTGYYVHKLYKSSFGRAPLLQEFTPDNATIASGVIVGTPGWDTRLLANKLAFVAAWVQRPAFLARYPGTLSTAAFVDALISNTGAAISSSDRAALIQAAGTSRAAALSLLMDNPTFSGSEFNPAFVEMQYFGYLGRDPDASGFNFWLTKLNQFNGDYLAAEMVRAFLESGEYRQRFQ
jgi:hypothetical protein